MTTILNNICFPSADTVHPCEPDLSFTLRGGRGEFVIPIIHSKPNNPHYHTSFILLKGIASSNNRGLYVFRTEYASIPSDHYDDTVDSPSEPSILSSATLLMQQLLPYCLPFCSRAWNRILRLSHPVLS